jgi:hypothetical protein
MQEKNPKPPVQLDDLFTLQKFIKEAKFMGIRVSKQTLEWLEQQDLLFPALRVTRPIEELLKVRIKKEDKEVLIKSSDLDKRKHEVLEPNPFYTYAGYTVHNKLETNKDNLIVELQTEYPSEKDFVPWDKYKESHWLRRPTQNIKKLEGKKDTYYTKTQLLLLGKIVNSLNLNLGGIPILKNEVEPEQLFDKWRDFLTKELTYIKHYAESFYSRTRVYYKLQDMHSEVYDKAFETARELYEDLKESEGEKEANKEANLEFDHRAQYIQNNDFQDSLKQLLEEEQIDVEDLLDYSRLFISLGRGNEEVYTKLFDVLSSIPTRRMSKIPGRFQFAYYSYQIANTFIQTVNIAGKEISLKHLLTTHDPDLFYCYYCKKWKKINYNQRNRKTCGDKKCRSVYKKELIKQKRRSGQY